MRPAAAAKQGFYPANPLAIREIAKHLTVRPPNPEKKYDSINILDPCAGEGVAVRGLAASLEIPEGNVYTIEIDSGRSESIKALMPNAHNVGPAGFAGVQITGCSFGIVYLNPPFDSILGGGMREEFLFTSLATPKLVPKGILVLVCPFNALNGNYNFTEYIDSHYEDVRAYKFPDGEDEEGNLIRPYNEIVVIGRKRALSLPSDESCKLGHLHHMMMHWKGYVKLETIPELGTFQPKLWYNGSPSQEMEETFHVWEIPHSWRPHTFKKTAFTDAELDKAVASSPLHNVLREVFVPPPAAPPLPLDKGHLGLILASGMLDGVVEGPRGIHVVRGSSHKVEYHNKATSTNEENPETGAVTTKDVFSQRMVTVIRAVEQNGTIATYSNEPTEEGHSDPERDL